MADEAVPQEEQTREAKAEATILPAGFTKEQVDAILARQGEELAAKFQERVENQLAAVLADPEGRKQFAEIYGLKLADVEAAAAEEEFLDPAEKKFRDYEARIAELESKFGAHDADLRDTSVAVNAQQIKEQFEGELASFVDEQPEVREPEIYRRLRRDVMHAIEADPRLGEPGNIKQMAAAWWADMTSAAPAVQRAFSTSARSRGRSGAVAEGKKPEDMSPDEARAAVLAAITGGSR